MIVRQAVYEVAVSWLTNGCEISSVFPNFT